MGESIGELTATLGLDPSNFQRGVTRVVSHSKELGDNFQKIARDVDALGGSFSATFARTADDVTSMVVALGSGGMLGAVSAVTIGVGLLVEAFSAMDRAEREAAEMAKKWADEQKKAIEETVQAVLNAHKSVTDEMVIRANEELKIAQESEDEVRARLKRIEGYERDAANNDERMAALKAKHSAEQELADAASSKNAARLERDTMLERQARAARNEAAIDEWKEKTKAAGSGRSASSGAKAAEEIFGMSAGDFKTYADAVKKEQTAMAEQGLMGMPLDEMRNYAAAVKDELTQIAAAYGMTREEFEKYIEAVKKETDAPKKDPKKKAKESAADDRNSGALDGLSAAARGDASGAVGGALKHKGMSDGDISDITGVIGIIQGFMQQWGDVLLGHAQKFGQELVGIAQNSAGVVTQRLMSGDNSKMGGAFSSASAVAGSSMAAGGSAAGFLAAMNMATLPLAPFAIAVGAATGGVLGLGMGLTSLIMETESFKQVQTILGKTTGLLVTAMEPVARQFIPMAYVVHQTTAALVPMLGMFANNETAGRALFEATKTLGLGMIGAGIAVTYMQEGVMRAGGKMFELYSHLAGLMGQDDGGAWETAGMLGGQADGLAGQREEMTRKWAELNGLLYDPAMMAGIALTELAESASETTRNLPSGYNALAARRRDARGSEDGSGGGGGGGGISGLPDPSRWASGSQFSGTRPGPLGALGGGGMGGPSIVVYGDIILNGVQDARKLARELMREVAADNYQITGIPNGLGGAFP